MDALGPLEGLRQGFDLRQAGEVGRQGGGREEWTDEPELGDTAAERGRVGHDHAREDGFGGGDGVPEQSRDDLSG